MGAPAGASINSTTSRAAWPTSRFTTFASKRARQINNYYADLHEGSLFDNIGPLVDSNIEDKPLSVALREINNDKLELKRLSGE